MILAGAFAGTAAAQAQAPAAGCEKQLKYQIERDGGWRVTGIMVQAEPVTAPPKK